MGSRVEDLWTQPILGPFAGVSLAYGLQSVTSHTELDSRRASRLDAAHHQPEVRNNRAS
jgi:hypothetical protein